MVTVADLGEVQYVDARDLPVELVELGQLHGFRPDARRGVVFLEVLLGVRQLVLVHEVDHLSPRLVHNERVD